MRILFVPIGTRGDVQPMAALALALGARGHEIRFAAPPNFQKWLTGLGLAPIAVGADFEALLARMGDDPLRGAMAMRSQFRAQFDALDGHARDVDLVLGSAVSAAAPTLAEKHGAAFRYVMFSPSLLPSREHPAPAVKWQRLPKWVNALTWKVNALAWRMLFSRELNALRKSVGLGPVKDTWAHGLGPEVWVASEPQLARLPADSPTPAVQVGAMFLPETDELSEDVRRFLDAGAPPMYLGFGSMTDRRPERTTAMIVEAVRRAGVRAIVSRGWAGLNAKDLPKDVHLAGPEPHGKLFARCSAVVHHGGAGTTTQAARAGVPQLLVPHLLDQFFWADRVHRAGISPKPLARGRLDAERLADALRELTSDDLQERARTFASTMTLDGVERVARMVEALGEREGSRPERTGS